MALSTCCTRGSPIPFARLWEEREQIPFPKCNVACGRPGKVSELAFASVSRSALGNTGRGLGWAAKFWWRARASVVNANKKASIVLLSFFFLSLGKSTLGYSEVKLMTTCEGLEPLGTESRRSALLAKSPLPVPWGPSGSSLPLKGIPCIPSDTA